MNIFHEHSFSIISILIRFKITKIKKKKSKSLKLRIIFFANNKLPYTSYHYFPTLPTLVPN